MRSTGPGIFWFLIILAILIVTGAPALGVNKATDAGVMGAAQIYPEEQYVFLRARAGGGHKTPYGFFVFDRATGNWSTLGTAAHYGNPVPWNNQKIDPETLFYSRSGYDKIQLGNSTYEIGWENGRAVVKVTGIESAQFASPEIAPPGSGSREYLFKYMHGSRLWFDMRVKTNNMLFSEGVGCFDTTDKSFHIFKAEQLHFHPERTIITRMTGTDEQLILGVSFCDQDTCLDQGGFIVVAPDKDPVLYDSDNARLPVGALLDIVPDNDLFWVATAYGVTQWKPGLSANRIFELSHSALVYSNPALRFWSDGTQAANNTVPDGTSVTIIRAINLGFVVSTPYPVTAWTSKAFTTQGLFISDDKKDLIVEPGNRVSFYSDPKPDAAFLGDIQSMDEIPHLKILQQQGDWIQVELTQNVWIPAQNIILNLMPVN